MSDSIPDFIVHYSRGEPFRSLTSVCAEDLDNVIGNLDETNAWGLARFSDQKYLAQRHQTEMRLKNRFIEIGGEPMLDHPIYFFLGRDAQFEKHERNVGYLIALRDLEPDSVSFTYGDSMFCFNQENRRQAGEAYLNPLCEELYSLESLPKLFSHPGFPKTNSLPIEAHLWRTPDLRIVSRLAR